MAAPIAWLNAQRALGPLDLSALDQVSSVALDHDGRLLRAFETPDGRWRLPVHARDVDPRFFVLLKAYEDKRFDHHHGVDFPALLRAAWQFVRFRHIVSGGSTLTMQAARLLEPRPDRNLLAKARQILRARQLEGRFSKEQILDIYLALAPYGGNLEGLRAASLAYFGKEPRRLSTAEAALLVAIPQSPEARRPDRNAKAARAARDRVIDRAVAAHALSPSEAARAKSEPPPLTRKPFPNLAPHVTEALARAHPGRRILHLTLDAPLQGSLERLARDRAGRLGPKLTMAILVIDNASGRILAHVGSPDYFSKARAGAIDMTEALRSPGSTLKPFIYAMAFGDGLAHPETLLDDAPTRYGAWKPTNFDDKFHGAVTAREALQLSLNLPAAQVLNAVGPARFVARMRGAGLPLVLPRDSDAGLAIGLGGVGVRLRDLARAYAAFPRGGLAPELIESLDDPPPRRPWQRIAEPGAAWQVADILRFAPPPDNGSTGRIAFKTGTSYGYRDALALGFDRAHTVAVWVGRADNGAVAGLIGRRVAAPILFSAFARIGGPNEPLPRPPGVLVATTAHLPPPLRHLRREAPKILAATFSNPLRITYPPDGARVDLGLLHAAAGRDRPELALKAQGGAPPLTWMINGAPLKEDPDAQNQRHDASWTPDGAGFARVSVIDANGAGDSVLVRLE
ncbi:penicillin-binding protein 1C [Rhodoblastus acidophilus]|uniref:peptidoglycan glycosyltransferase n=1 Tax=Candidatus Rhodoblastus alkanivorans TaxID=2954117 RepID=A0ABS9ZAD3_9HYPH|nr:penicillin-binding protein 1C [Candidatus Rhodoblastus alkanivorans]MCI4677847.1 penicillin-binding protein 1C [Candidatus Rhodoblastus alkanivorans]MCI4684654.1 penicillin-binding protein 1C [Candidatus Rhodoblastus alkanivorans]MDI4641976.1 penicillin-binding protein 1C [Rhodoblastus acidophilus]